MYTTSLGLLKYEIFQNDKNMYLSYQNFANEAFEFI